MLLEYGPYGSGHDHPDRLHISFFGLGEELCPDAGSWGYDNPLHLTWANQSMAHNTLTVDEVRSGPQGMFQQHLGRRIRRAALVRRAAAVSTPGSCSRLPGRPVTRSMTGVSMDRSLALRPYGLVDVFRVTADRDNLRPGAARAGPGGAAGPGGQAGRQPVQGPRLQPPREPPRGGPRWGVPRHVRQRRAAGAGAGHRARRRYALLG